MEEKFKFPENRIKMYETYGFSIVEVFNSEECKILENFAKNWVYSLLTKWIDKKDKFPLEEYHIWSKKLGITHEQILCAKNRYMYPEENIEKILLNDPVKSFLNQIGIETPLVWDNQLGTVGVRLIRPGMNDGYPLSKKEWGPAKNVISCWIPIIGRSSNETLLLVPKSHLKECEKYLPEDTKFTSEEYRFKGNTKELDTRRLSLEPGQVVFFHPKTLHSEDVEKSNITRLNLEIRFYQK